MENLLQCPICYDIAVEAVEAVCCNNIFCEKCVIEYAESNGAEIECPLCRTLPFKAKKSVLAQRIITEMTINCPNKCDSKIIKTALQSHLDICPNREIENNHKNDDDKDLLIHGPPKKRRKLSHFHQIYNNNNNDTNNISLTKAIGEILFVREATFDRIKSIISSRTSININNLQYELNQIADYHGPNKCYYLKNNKQIYDGINWENSTILTESEKQIIRNRTKPKSNNNNNNKCVTSSKSNCFESKCAVISDENMYIKYDEIYNNKFNQMNVYIKSYKENTVYFHEMRAMINKEINKEKKKKMTDEFRQIFESRKGGLNRMKASIEKLKVELAVIKNRVNAYVNQQHQLQQQKSI